MKKAKKFSTFEALKSCESEPIDDALSLKRHDAFEKVIKDIRSVSIYQSHQDLPPAKPHGGKL